MKTILNKLLALSLCLSAFPLAAENGIRMAEKPAVVPVKKAVKAEMPAVVPVKIPAESYYDRVLRELSPLPHRLPGSPEYYCAIGKMEKILTEAGIRVRRQVYPTLVPEIVRNEFTVDGTSVSIAPLAPNNLALITTGEKRIDAPLVYIPKEELYKNYGRIEGKIVLLDWGENYYPKTFFTEGTKAIIFVGNSSATQWDIAKLQSQYNLSYPYFYITREEAAKHHLLEATPGKERRANLLFHSRWKEVDGINLWAEISPEEPEIFNLNRPEAVVLGARMDTFGAVPGLVSGDRQTANLALFAETAASLVKKKLPRAVFLILYGSSFNAYDSLRFFYFPIYKRNETTEPVIQDYAAGFREEFRDNEKLLHILSGNPVVKNESPMEFRTRMLLRDVIVKNYNLKNYRLAEINSQLRKIKRELEKKGVAAPASAKKEELKKHSTALREEKAQLDKDKVRVANMRRSINEREIRKSEAALLKYFSEQVIHSLTLRKQELESGIRMADCWNEIAAAAKPYAFVGAYYFDFSSDDMPFILSTRSYECVHAYSEITVSAYSKYFEAFRKMLPGLKFQKGKTPFFLESLKSATFTPDTMTSLSVVYLPQAAGIPLKLSSFTLRNLPGNYDYDEIPGRRSYHLKGLTGVMDEFLTAVIREESLSMYPQLEDPILYDNLLNYYYKNGDSHGQVFSYLSADGKEIDGPAASAFAIVQQNEYDRIPPICGFSLCAFGKINQDGYTTMPLLTTGGRWGAGKINIAGAAMGFDDFGHTKYINTQESYFKLFRCYGGPHIYAYAPLTSNFGGSLSLVDGFTDGKFKNFRTYARVATGDGYAYADRDIKAKLYFFNETFMLGNSPENPTGEGISIAPEDLLNLNVSRVAIGDTILLNLQRLEKLHKRNIFNGVIEQYHDKAEQHQTEAKAARTAGKINLARAHELFGQTLAVRAYRPLRDTINDLVKSVLILLILTIPFAFALERLLIGATNIYKQLGWVLFFFVATFALLYFTHPAFALSQAPLIIFIAFFIIVMSLVVIYILMNRFKSEILALQGLDTSAHRVNTENSMLLAAILIGVSSMRNRPIKTFLTILTVVLLSFTIISFASFDSTEYVRPVYMGDGSGEVRIESFLPQHVDLLMPTCQAIKDLYAEDYDVYYRSACYNNPFFMSPVFPLQVNIIYNPACTKEEKTITLEALVGFEAGERIRSAKLAGLMPPPVSIPLGTENLPGVYLSALTAEKIELKPGDVFYLRNKKVRLDGVFKGADLDSFTYLDGGKAAPPNFEATASAEEKSRFSVFNSAYVDASNFIWSSPDLTLLTDYETARDINGFINAVILYPKQGKNPDIIQNATEIAEVAFGIVYSNTANGVHRHFMAPVFSASGISNLIVPLLLGALIILSSLLGSIADREREIFTFSALGLSPKDVSMLFFAESGVYAVIGGLGGYLLSQLVNALLIELSKHGLLQAPEMNYSSMTTVYTILIVMLIVLLSTIYPAIKAARSASPDVARKWKMPPPDGNMLCFQFPFTVSRVDFGGILMFISEHFTNHMDSSLGSFAASNIEVLHGVAGLTDGYLLSVNLTLAPFDLGVAEELKMYSAPSDIEGVDVVTMNILRKDGSRSAWLRGNRRFVDEIRNQFLLWRSLPVETVMHYRKLAEMKLKDGAGAPEGEKA